MYMISGQHIYVIVSALKTHIYHRANKCVKEKS